VIETRHGHNGSPVPRHEVSARSQIGRLLVLLNSTWSRSKASVAPGVALVGCRHDNRPEWIRAAPF
jgi:hypothetical protein